MRFQLADKLIGTILATIVLASCTASAPQTEQLPQSLSNPGPQPDFGMIISIRPVSFPPGKAAELAGVNAVLSALGQRAVSPPVTGEEIVIQKDDGNPASIAEQRQLTSLSIGDHIIVVQGSAPTIIHRN